MNAQFMIKNVFSYSAIIVVTVFTISSCQPEVIVPDQSKIFTTYSLTYNESLNKTTAKASFGPSAGSSQLQELTNPANVLYKGDELLFNYSENLYQKEFIGLEEGDFSYVDLDDNNYVNTVNMISAIEFVDIPDSLNINSDLYFSIDGSPLLSNEELLFTFESLDSEVVLFFTSTSISTATIIIDYQELQSLGAGKVKLVIGRKSTTNPITSSPEAGGELLITYEIEDTIVFF
jgi:hypothetical protein